MPEHSKRKLSKRRLRERSNSSNDSAGEAVEKPSRRNGKGGKFAKQPKAKLMESRDSSPAVSSSDTEEMMVNSAALSTRNSPGTSRDDCVVTKEDAERASDKSANEEGHESEDSDASDEEESVQQEESSESEGSCSEAAPLVISEENGKKPKPNNSRSTSTSASSDDHEDERKCEEEKQDHSESDSKSSSLDDGSPKRLKREKKSKKLSVKQSNSSIGDNPRLTKLKQYARTAGLRPNYKKLFADCANDKKRIRLLEDYLQRNGLTGRLSIEVCKKFAKKRAIEKEVSELDTSNIIADKRRTRAATKYQMPEKTSTIPFSASKSWKERIGLQNDLFSDSD
uniref:Histone chaperone domain-containing protein n=1 Tax=Trichuris muris TaxID=70415 RepID=A0A5S6R2I6_TRIMR